MIKPLTIAIIIFVAAPVATPPKDYQLKAAIENLRQRKLEWLESGDYVKTPMPHKTTTGMTCWGGK